MATYLLSCVSYPFALIRTDGVEEGGLGIDVDSGLVVDDGSGEGVMVIRGGPNARVYHQIHRGIGSFLEAGSSRDCAGSFSFFRRWPDQALAVDDAGRRSTDKRQWPELH